MLKETIICIIIVITIFSLDMFTQRYTNKTIEEVTGILSNLKEEVLDSNKEKVKDGIDSIDKKWGSSHDKLAYYIEHDELEKVDTAIVRMKSYVEADDYSSAVAEIDEGIFVLEHIQKKYSFNLQNIF